MTIRTVEIAICTWNRVALLHDTIGALNRILVPPCTRCRIIVVDNASTDGSAAVANAAVNRDLFEVLVVREQQQGHTFARNRAIAESKAELIAWIDDDVRVEPQWLARIVYAAERNPRAAFFGGPIRPVFPSGVPDWITENWATLHGCFAARDLGETAIDLAADRLPYGANFAVRGDVQRKFPFDTSLGRRGSAVLGEDELDLMRRLLLAGHRGMWVPDAAVEHVIPADRATEDYVRSYFVGQGRKLVLAGRPWSRWPWRLALIQSWHDRLYRFKRPRAKSAAWLAHLARSGLAEGQLQQLREGRSARCASR